MKWVKGLAVLGLALCCAWFAPARAGVDLGRYVADDSFGTIKLSPTGEYYAMTVQLEAQYGLVIMRRADREVTATFRFSRGTDIHDFWWVNPERVLIAVAENFGSREDALPTGELYAINADGSRRDLLIGWRVRVEQTGSRLISRKQEGLVAAHLIDTLPGDDRSVLIRVHAIGRDPSTVVERMDVYSGRRSRVTSAPVAWADYVTDNTGTVRFAYGSNTDNVSRTYLRAGDDAPWMLINDQRESGGLVVPLGFSPDDTTAYLQVEHATGPDSIVALDIASGERRELLRDAVLDPVPVYVDAAGAPIGAYFHGAQPRVAFFDPEAPQARMLRSLQAAFADQTVSVTSATRDGGIRLVRVGSDVDPGSYYEFDSRTKGADFVFARSAAIDPAQMANRRGVSLRARDGLPLHGFLTVPRDTDARDLPLVVLPHGGPYGIFDTWGYDTDSQILAAAGYAVLQINFRGSGNYGRAFRHAGAREWGGRMQDDVTDATRWAVEQGIADPDRICIYGASYGAYAALMGTVRAPELYRCAAGYVGVYDLPRIRTENRRQGRSASTWTGEWLGTDTATLAAASPTRLADGIGVPVFLAAGGEDMIAPVEHTRLMERALKRADVPVETLYYPNEGHGFYNVEHRREFYRRLLDFLHRHIGGQQAAS